MVFVFIIFVILFFTSLSCLILGLIKPELFTSIFKRIPSKREVGTVFAVITVISFILIIVTAPPEDQKQPSVQSSNADATQSPTDLDRFPALKDLVSGNNNDNQVKLKNFEYFPGTGALNLDINLDQTIGDPAKSIEIQIADAYMSVFNQKDVPEVTTMTVTGWLPEVDSYGNSKYVEAVGTRLNKTDASKVNWNIDKPTLELQILPGLWKTFFAMPSLNWSTTNQ